jgi:ATPase subunit of ABC transporter with duplicated ATPase domains
MEKPWEGWQLNLALTPAGRSGDVVARMDAAVVQRGSFSLGPVDLELGWADRVAIMGPNGGGKSTLLAALLGRLSLVAGQRWMGPGVAVGELDQARQRLAGASSLLGGVVAETGLLPEEARSLLAKFGLGAEHVARPAASLSPGERTRAQLAALMASGTNCLVLDEPTNHLDLPAIEQLESALERFQGTLLVVSHDRWLLESLRVTRSWLVDAGRVTEGVA